LVELPKILGGGETKGRGKKHEEEGEREQNKSLGGELPHQGEKRPSRHTKNLRKRIVSSIKKATGDIKKQGKLWEQRLEETSCPS